MSKSYTSTTYIQSGHPGKKEKKPEYLVNAFSVVGRVSIVPVLLMIKKIAVSICNYYKEVCRHGNKRNFHVL